MEENSNLFQKAINNNNLFDFALGNGEYYLIDREYGTHWTLGIWLYHIIPCFDKNEGINEINDMFEQLLNTTPQNIAANDSLLMHTYTYVSLLKSGRIKNKVLKDATIIEAIEKLSTYFDFLKTTDANKYEEDIYVFNLLKDRFQEIKPQ